MSASGTNPGSSSVQLVLNTDAITHSSMTSIMINHTFTTLLFSLLIALFYSSTSQSRRRLVFILNVVAIILAFARGLMIDTFAIRSIFYPNNPWPPFVYIAAGIVGVFQSILVDSILLARLISVHPIRHLGLIRFALLTATPILLKAARIVNLVLFIRALAPIVHGPLSPESITLLWATTTPYLKIECSAQTADNAYASFALLWTVQYWGYVHPPKATLAQRLYALCRITLSNFIIPSLFSVAQLVIVYCDVDVVTANQIECINTMLAVIGVVFATVWAGNVSRRDAQISLWPDESIDDIMKRHSHRSTFPATVGTWGVPNPPPAAMLGSTGHSVPVGGAYSHWRV